MNMEKRLQWALSGYNTSQFYYGQLEGVFYDPYLSQFIDRDLATATRTIQGGTAFAIYPFNRYRRVEVFGGFNRYQESYNDPLVQEASDRLPEEQSTAGSSSTTATWCRSASRSCRRRPSSASSVRSSGSTMRLSLRDLAEDRQHAVAADVRWRRAQVLPPRRHRPAGAARPRLQEHGRQPRLHLLRRQQRVARLRVPAVLGPERVLRQRRTALPADRRDGHADRHPRRRARDALCRPRRRLLRGLAVQVLDATTRRSSGPSSATTTSRRK